MAERAMRTLFSGVMVLLLSGCSPAAPSTGASPLELVRFRAGGTAFTWQSDFHEPARLVIRDQAAWDDAWEQLGDVLIPFPSPARPQIDFSTHMLVLVAIGSQSSGGHSVVLESATGIGGEITVVGRQVSPGPGCFTTLNITQPVDLARLPLSMAPVQFEIRQVVTDCG
jgi:hypothetical protein